MSTDLIRYDLLVQEALKSVVRRVLGDAAREGLPGEHHFYVSFRTDHAGVRLSPRLRDKYPKDMTIVLQHQFDELTVNERAFEVGLSFSGIAERLRVPFEALTGFFDPSVQFGLKFETSEGGEEGEDAPHASAAPAAVPLPAPKGSVPSTRGADAKAKPAKLPTATSRPVAKKVTSQKSTAEEKQPDAAPGAEVVSLDAFRKKN